MRITLSTERLYTAREISYMILIYDYLEMQYRALKKLNKGEIPTDHPNFKDGGKISKESFLHITSNFLKEARVSGLRNIDNADAFCKKVEEAMAEFSASKYLEE